MPKVPQKPSLFACLLAMFWLAFTGLAHANTADKARTVSGRYASIVVDADSLDIIHARQIDEIRYPASLTKVMTLYLTFDALNAGDLTLKTKLKVSKKAQRVSPSKLGLKAGRTITVEDAIQALAVKSANDAAIVLAEALAPTTDDFAIIMSQKALGLGMQNTVFKNPHGLPDKTQYSTARDLAKLSVAMINNHRRYYHYFGQETFRYKGKTYKNTNGLLKWLEGVDGLKTGYTRASGYNLIVSAQRENRRIIAIVLGGASGKSRNKHMKDLIERGFETMGVKPVVSIPPVAIVRPTPRLKPKASPNVAKAIRLRGRDSKPLTIVNGSKNFKVSSWRTENAWSIQVGAFSKQSRAREHANQIAAHLPDNSKLAITTLKRKSGSVHRVRFTGLSYQRAKQSCEALADIETACKIISPSS
ncbi:MAG: serine hydrolase [Maricaulaceae bacterium]